MNVYKWEETISRCMSRWKTNVTVSWCCIAIAGKQSRVEEIDDDEEEEEVNGEVEEIVSKKWLQLCSKRLIKWYGRHLYLQAGVLNLGFLDLYGEWLLCGESSTFLHFQDCIALILFLPVHSSYCLIFLPMFLIFLVGNVEEAEGLVMLSVMQGASVSPPPPQPKKREGGGGGQ